MPKTIITIQKTDDGGLLFADSGVTKAIQVSSEEEMRAAINANIFFGKGKDEYIDQIMDDLNRVGISTFSN